MSLINHLFFCSPRLHTPFQWFCWFF